MLDPTIIRVAYTVDQAEEVATELGLPVIISSAYSTAKSVLVGSSNIALRSVARSLLEQSPIREVGIRKPTTEELATCRTI